MEEKPKQLGYVNFELAQGFDVLCVTDGSPRLPYFTDNRDDVGRARVLLREFGPEGVRRMVIAVAVGSRNDIL